MSVNKVAVNGETIIDLTEDSVTPESLLKGTTAHNKAGESITGSLEVDTREVWVCYPFPDLSQFSTAVTVTTPLFTFGRGAAKGVFNRIRVTATQISHLDESDDVYPRYSTLRGWASDAVRVLFFDEPVDETSEAYAVLSKIATKTVFEALGSIQVSKSVSATENGTVEIVPDSGFDMLLKATVEVNVDAPAPVLQEKTIAPTTSEQVVTPDDGYDGLSSVTVKEISTEMKSVELSMASGDQTISRSTNKFMTSVVVKKPSTLIPENIKKDVVIGGVTGTYEGSGGGNGGSGSYDVAVTENSDGSQNLAITDAASSNLPVVETWVLNEDLNNLYGSSIDILEWISFSVYDISYNMIRIFSNSYGIAVNLYNMIESENAETLISYTTELALVTQDSMTGINTGWINGDSSAPVELRTLKFHEAVPDGDFKTWLQANAVKQ